jgi:hypothetical protein
MIVVNFSLEQGSKYYGRIDGMRFYIGGRVNYKGLKGLMNVSGQAPDRYDAAPFRQEFGAWADFIYPTAMAEGALYHTLNSYDRARFTFGFLQYAAHVPNGDFVLFLRELLALELAAEYFPDLQLRKGRIWRLRDDSAVQVETDDSTAALMDYLNPSSQEVEDTEVIQAAKFVHWSKADPAHRRVQVACGIAHMRRAMRDYARLYALDGKPDVVCLLVADIRHQGRGSSLQIRNALAAAAPEDALLRIGSDAYPGRATSLKQSIRKLRDEGRLGRLEYDAASGDFH